MKIVPFWIPDLEMSADVVPSKNRSMSRQGSEGVARCVDVALASMSLIVAAPLMVLTALAIRIIDGPPVIFSQFRVGRYMRPFLIYKFRTMRDSPESNSSLTVGRDSRITSLGYWLRCYHLDELPQIFNIIKGDMSFIGPRPEIPEFIVPEDPGHQRLVSVRPGLIDDATLYWHDEAYILGQANDWGECYREMIFPDKVARSLRDIESRTLWSDVRLVRKTIGLLFRAHGRW